LDRFVESPFSCCDFGHDLIFNPPPFFGLLFGR
jgi:hypothetical protein